MIEDQELRQLFKTESEEHLQALENGILHLESGPQDAGAVHTLFREAHSLKGAARMLGLEEIETIMHAVEDLLRDADAGGTAPEAGVVDRVYRALDQVKLLVDEAVTGKRATVDLRRTLAALRGQDAGGTDPKMRPPVPAPSSTTGRAAAESAAEQGIGIPPAVALASAGPLDIPAADPRADPDRAPHVAPADHRIDTIRVSTSRLDSLMNQAGELLVAHQRQLRNTEDLATLRERLEALRRSLSSAGEAESASPRGPRRHWSEILHQTVDHAHRLGERLQEDDRHFDSLIVSLSENVREARLLPVSTLFNLFPRTVRDIAHAEAKEVQLEFAGADTTADKHVIEVLKDPLMHILRNAVHHGIEPPEERLARGKLPAGTITLAARREGGEVVISARDDGRGLDFEAIRRTAGAMGLLPQENLERMSPGELSALVFRPGFTTEHIITDISGRGVGLDVVHAALAQLKGHITVDSAPGEGTSVELRLPVTLTTTRILVAGTDGLPLGIPMDGIRNLRNVDSASIYLLEGRPVLDFEGHALTVIELADALRLGRGDARSADKRHCIVIEAGGALAAVLVDEIYGEQEVLLKPLGGVLRRVINVLGNTILSDGRICTVLSPADLVRGGWQTRQRPPATDRAPAPKMVLLAEDSMVSRVQLKRILEGAGYRVVTAVDGLDALDKLRQHRVDGVVSDINMPRLDGLALTERLRATPAFHALPVVLVTSLKTEDDRRRGLEAGASAYLTKDGFDASRLITTLERLI